MLGLFLMGCLGAPNSSPTAPPSEVLASSSCVCDGVPPEPETAAVLASGVVVEQHATDPQSNGPRRYVVQLTTIWVSDDLRTRLMFVSRGPCDLRGFEVGQAYLFALYRNPDGFLHAPDCLWTKRIDDVKASFWEHLGTGVAVDRHPAATLRNGLERWGYLLAALGGLALGVLIRPAWASGNLRGLMRRFGVVVEDG
jgi:hypothetical protein